MRGMRHARGGRSRAQCGFLECAAVRLLRLARGRWGERAQWGAARHHFGHRCHRSGCPVHAGVFRAHRQGGFPGGTAVECGGGQRGSGLQSRGHRAQQTGPEIRGGDLVSVAHRRPLLHRIRHAQQQRLRHHGRGVGGRYRPDLQCPLFQLALRAGGLRRAGGGCPGCRGAGADLGAHARCLCGAGQAGQPGDGGRGSQPAPGAPQR